MQQLERELRHQTVARIAAIATADKLNANDIISSTSSRNRVFCPVTAHGIEIVARVDPAAEASLLPLQYFDKLPHRVRSKLEDLKFAYLLDYEGREGSPPIGKITLPVHAFASINHKDFGGMPNPLEGKQLIEFVPHGETAIIGQNVLFENNFFSTT